MIAFLVFPFLFLFPLIDFDEHRKTICSLEQEKLGILSVVQDLENQNTQLQSRISQLEEQLNDQRKEERSRENERRKERKKERKFCFETKIGLQMELIHDSEETSKQSTTEFAIFATPSESIES
jgi:uncharacterized protein YlxW (UPF0749 family)